MIRIVAVANQKGGVGKTTTAVNVASSLAHLGERVLLVDADPQGNATSGLGVDRDRVGLGVYDVLLRGVPVERCWRATSVTNLLVLPASAQLGGAEMELPSVAGRESVLRGEVRRVADSFGLILIDCPPSLGLLTLNALVAAEGVLVPVQCEYYALEGLAQLVGAVRRVQESWNPELDVLAVLLTMFDGRTNLSFQVAEEVKRVFRGKVLRSVVPRNVRLSEAPSHGVPIDVYDGKSRGAGVYREVAEEVLQRARNTKATGARAR